MKTNSSEWLPGHCKALLPLYLTQDFCKTDPQAELAERKRSKIKVPYCSAEMIRLPKVHPDVADFVKNILAPLLANKVLGEIRKDRRFEKDCLAHAELDESERVSG